MTERLLDIHLSFDAPSLGRLRDATRTVYEASLHAAEQEAAATGARLRHPDPRETVVKTAEDPLTGRDVLLVGTRWVCDQG